jgi:hypothetical protein
MKLTALYKFALLVPFVYGLCACSGEQAKTVDTSAVPVAATVDTPHSGLPDWSGIWIAEGLTAEISGFGNGGPDAFKLVGATAPWNETGQARFGAMMQGFGTGNGKADGWGYPMMMNAHPPLQFLISPNETLIINMYRDTRHVYTDGREHPPEIDRWVTTWGESVGYWEGDTLVIDTISVREPTVFFFFSPPFSDQAHYVERLRMTAPDRIESEFTIEDPVTLTEPWVVNVAYLKTSGLDRLIHDDYTNDRSGLDENNVFSIEPTAQ